MRNMLAIASKELRSYFAGPIAYIAIGLWALLYGFNEQNDGSDGDVWRTQLSLMYAIFD